MANVSREGSLGPMIRSQAQNLLRRRFGRFYLLEKNPRGKFRPNYKGPYVVSKVLLGGALQLSSIDGDFPQELVNSNSVNYIMFECPFSLII